MIFFEDISPEFFSQKSFLYLQNSEMIQGEKISTQKETIAYHFKKWLFKLEFQFDFWRLWEILLNTLVMMTLLKVGSSFTNFDLNLDQAHYISSAIKLLVDSILICIRIQFIKFQPVVQIPFLCSLILKFLLFCNNFIQ